MGRNKFAPAQALAAAREAAAGLDVRIGGGPATVRQFLAPSGITHITFTRRS
jgi:hypothetical protein